MSDEISEDTPKQVPPPLLRDEIVERAPMRSDPLPRTSARSDDSDTELRLHRPAVTTEDRLFGVFSHLGGYITWIFAPTVLLLVQKDRGSFGAWHAREALNFNICLVAYALLPTPLLCLGFIDERLLLVAVVLILGWSLLGALYQLIVVIFACVQAGYGVRFRYPLIIRIFPHPQATNHSDTYVDLD
jgi:uncharacterized protein